MADIPNILDRGGFTSVEQTITSAGSLTLAHGLTRTPTQINAHLVNKTAEFGYSVGDKLIVSPAQSGASTSDNKGISIVPDATNLNIRFGADTNAIDILNKTTGVGIGINNANWNIVFEAQI